jgi:hypothetical protein
LHIKFAPIWQAAIGVIKLIADSSDEGESIVWPLVLDTISALSVPKTLSTSADTIENASQFESHSDSLIKELIEADNGSYALSTEAANSWYFYCEYEHETTDIITDDNENGSGVVTIDSRADNNTVYASVWKILELCPNITLKRSKFVVPLFNR